MLHTQSRIPRCSNDKGIDFWSLLSVWLCKLLEGFGMSGARQLRARDFWWFWKFTIFFLNFFKCYPWKDLWLLVTVGGSLLTWHLSLKKIPSVVWSIMITWLDQSPDVQGLMLCALIKIWQLTLMCLAVCTSCWAWNAVGSVPLARWHLAKPRRYASKIGRLSAPRLEAQSGTFPMKYWCVVVSSSWVVYCTIQTSEIN